MTRLDDGATPDDLLTIVDMASDLARLRHLDVLLTRVTRRTAVLLSADITFVVIPHAKTGSGRVHAVHGTATTLADGFAVSSESRVINLVTRSADPFLTSDYLSDQRTRSSDDDDFDALVMTEKIAGLLAVPMTNGADVFGVLVAAFRAPHEFGSHEVMLSSALADHAAVAVERVRLIEAMDLSVAALRSVQAEGQLRIEAAQQAVQAQHAMLTLILSGCDIEKLLEFAADVLDADLLLSGPFGRCIGYAGRPPHMNTDDLLLVSDLVANTDSVTESADGWVMPIRAGGRNLAALLCWPRHPGAQISAEAIVYAAEAVGCLLLMRPTETDSEDFNQREQLFDDILNSEAGRTRELRDRLQRLGVNLSGPASVVVIRPSKGRWSHTPMWSGSLSVRLSGLATLRDGCLVVLTRGEVATQTACEVLRCLPIPRQSSVTVGAAGPIYDLDSVAAAYSEARRCLDALTALDLTGPASVDDLGFAGLLLARNSDIPGFLQRMLGQLAEYDDSHNSELLTTLDAYFHAGKSPVRAAEQLHVHPNTVVRRLARVTELLGDQWTEHDRALDLQLALRLWRLHLSPDSSFRTR